MLIAISDPMFSLKSRLWIGLYVLCFSGQGAFAHCPDLTGTYKNTETQETLQVTTVKDSEGKSEEDARFKYVFLYAVGGNPRYAPILASSDPKKGHYCQENTLFIRKKGGGLITFKVNDQGSLITQGKTRETWTHVSKSMPEKSGFKRPNWNPDLDPKKNQGFKPFKIRKSAEEQTCHEIFKNITHLNEEMNQISSQANDSTLGSIVTRQTQANDPNLGNAVARQPQAIPEPAPVEPESPQIPFIDDGTLGHPMSREAQTASWDPLWTEGGQSSLKFKSLLEITYPRIKETEDQRDLPSLIIPKLNTKVRALVKDCPLCHERFKISKPFISEAERIVHLCCFHNEVAPTVMGHCPFLGCDFTATSNLAYKTKTGTKTNYELILSLISDHGASVHTGERPYQCIKCGKTFSYQPSVSRHKDTCKGPKKEKEPQLHKCGRCKFESIYKTSLTRHWKKTSHGPNAN